jgi:NAD(P)-dependent dehydrogenase (short-subunit alcohol dehydrogenase family)
MCTAVVASDCPLLLPPWLLLLPLPQAEAGVMFKAGRGKIINTASMASLLVPYPQKQAAYNASKAAGEGCMMGPAYHVYAAVHLALLDA